MCDFTLKMEIKRKDSKVNMFLRPVENFLCDVTKFSQRFEKHVRCEKKTFDISRVQKKTSGKFKGLLELWKDRRRANFWKREFTWYFTTEFTIHAMEMHVW